MSVPIAGADFAGRRGLMPVEADEACPQVRVLDMDRKTAGDGALCASLDRADDGDGRDRRDGQDRHRDNAAFPEHSQELGH
jgi:hypothetical protein